MDVFRTVQTLLRRQVHAEVADVEGQQVRPLDETTAAAAQASAPRDRVGMYRLASDPSQPSIPPIRSLPSLSFFSSSSAGGRTRQEANNSPVGPRPTSSRYSGSVGDNDSSVLMVSPKTPQFPAFAGALHAETTAPEHEPVPVSVPVTTPPVAVLWRGDDSSSDRERDDLNSSPGRRHRRWFRGADPAEVHLADLADAGRRRRQRQRQRGNHSSSDSSSSSSSSSRSGRRPHQERHASAGSAGHANSTTMDPAPISTAPPAYSASTATTPTSTAAKSFLFCFPPVRSRRMRAHILRCSVSGLFVVLMLGVYVGLSVTHNVTNSEFSVLLVLVLVVAAVVFAHSLGRLCMRLLRPPSAADEAAAEARYQLRRQGRGAGADGPAALGFGAHYGPGGYALPRQPIRVVLARDEEIAGAASEAAKGQPPAYGLWRESVRVDPNRLYWQRNETPAGLGSIDENASAGRSRSSNRSNSSRDRSRSTRPSSDDDGSRRTSSISTTSSITQSGRESRNGRSSPRPPSYASDDGVRYVVEAQPRSIAPTTDVPLPQHPAEAGRTGGPAAW